jgi:hypothetical protein
LVQQHLKGVPDSRGEFEEFAKVEEQVLATFNKAIRQRQRGAIDDAQLLELIDRDVLPPWRSERERLARINGGPAARQWSVGRLTRYMETREQGWLLLCRALRENDSGLVEQANTKLQEADKLAESIAADAGGRRR